MEAAACIWTEEWLAQAWALAQCTVWKTIEEMAPEIVPYHQDRLLYISSFPLSFTLILNFNPLIL